MLTRTPPDLLAGQVNVFHVHIRQERIVPGVGIEKSFRSHSTTTAWSLVPAAFRQHCRLFNRGLQRSVWENI
ncbi:hypothetical protein SCLCIDRAFT_1216971 [Scleroderma citrinum Foug A]|uniref:Uncharacterized protein n=1 Tax=Scleroderma citrinum Foug A TaxID=1036808 RepID=A0A0C3DHP5_9AGAM|nr:hypothetical protein SCLCIDRAFT_1216971 [Scleroderma citrinum Foug A]